MSSTTDTFKKRQEEAKKKQSGELPPYVDQDGKIINPHNPSYITKVPWYLGESGPTLKHHSVQKNDHVLSVAETDALLLQRDAQRKQQKAQKPLTFRKGACKNCGAMTHSAKDCVERPRSAAKSAWKTGLDICADDVTLQLDKYGKVSYDAKRDAWQGYNAAEYKDVVDKYDRLEAERRKVKEEEKRRAEGNEINNTVTSITSHVSAEAAQQSQKPAATNDSDSESESEDDAENDSGDEYKQRDEAARDFQARQARQGGVGGNEMKTTVRNLRIREDTPKYLRNLDLESAYYDPKSRSMRNNPQPDANPNDLLYAGDNFIRNSGDALVLAQNQLMCWEMQARGEDIDVIANPSAAELVIKEVKQKKTTEKSAKQQALVDKYGSAATVMDPRLLLGQTEVMKEYNMDGREKHEVVKSTRTTKYEEDVYINNHTSVWGSYFNKNKMSWGYACCHSTLRNSYCTGFAGRSAQDTAATSSSRGAEVAAMLKSTTTTDKKGDKSTGKAASDDSKKRGVFSQEVSAEDVEEYRLKRLKAEDPMANLMNSDELLEYKK